MLEDLEVISEYLALASEEESCQLIGVYLDSCRLSICPPKPYFRAFSGGVH